MNKFVFLSKEFYTRHLKQHHTEIEQKQDRPYIQVCVEIDGIQYAIPMRSHIKHKYVLWTDKGNGCGLDFSKAVVIENPKDIDDTKKPYIRENEFASLIGKEYIIKTKLRKYIENTKKLEPICHLIEIELFVSFQHYNILRIIFDRHIGGLFVFSLYKRRRNGM